jgi:hypothetical protein
VSAGARREGLSLEAQRSSQECRPGLGTFASPWPVEGGPLDSLCFPVRANPCKSWETKLSVTSTHTAVALTPPCPVVSKAGAHTQPMVRSTEEDAEPLRMLPLELGA